MFDSSSYRQITNPRHILCIYKWYSILYNIYCVYIYILYIYVKLFTYHWEILFKQTPFPQRRPNWPSAQWPPPNANCAQSSLKAIASLRWKLDAWWNFMAIPMGGQHNWVIVKYPYHIFDSWKFVVTCCDKPSKGCFFDMLRLLLAMGLWISRNPGHPQQCPFRAP